MKPHGVLQQITFNYGHRLLDYQGKCAHLHGHNGMVEILLETERLDPRGMVADFGDIKEVLKTWISTHLDHKMLLRRDDPLLAVLRDYEEPVYAMDENPTAENIAHLIFDVARKNELPVTEVRLWETPTSCAIYRGSM